MFSGLTLRPFKPLISFLFGKKIRYRNHQKQTFSYRKKFRAKKAPIFQSNKKWRVGNHSDTQIVRKPFFFGILATMKKLKKSLKEKCFFYDKNKARGCRRSYQKSFVFENFFFSLTFRYLTSFLSGFLVQVEKFLLR